MKKTVIWNAIACSMLMHAHIICMEHNTINHDIWNHLIARSENQEKNSLAYTCKTLNSLSIKTNHYLYIHSPLILSQQQLVFALLCATYYQNEYAVNNLIQHGADPNQYPQGIDILPLTIAGVYNNRSLIQLLKQYNAKNSISMPPPYALAAYIGDVHYLDSSLPDKQVFYFDRYQKNPFFHIAIYNGHTHIVAHLLKQPPIQQRLIRQHWCGITPIQHAAQYGRCAIMQLLLDYDASLLNKIDLEEYTILHTAVCYKQYHVIQTLLKHPEIKVNFCSQNRSSPLHTAVTNNDLQTVTLLLSCPKICVNIKNNENKTPLDIANKLETHEIKNLLIKNSAKTFFDLKKEFWDKK